MAARLRLSVLLLIFGCLALASGCANVKAWERGVLADPCMAPTPDPEESKLEQHFFAYREGSAGGSGDSGGGCGCN